MKSTLSVLVEIAAYQHGFFTSAQAVESGIARANVRQMAARGTLEKRFNGLYRIPSFPYSENSDHAEAALWANGKGVIIDESALELWNLSDVNPKTIHIGIPKSYRIQKKIPSNYEVRKVDLVPQDIDEVTGIPTLIPKLAINRSIKNFLRSDLAEQAIDQALHRGYLTKREEARLRVQLDDRKELGK